MILTKKEYMKEYYRRNRNEILKRGKEIRDKKLQIKNCSFCNKKFKQKRINQDICSECSKKNLKEYQKKYHTKYQIDYYYKNKEKFRKYNQKWRNNHKEKYNKSRRKWYQKNKDKTNKWTGEYRKINKEKYNTWMKTRREIEIKGLCQKCKKEKAVDRHHLDYSKPLKIMLLCRQCHINEHKKLNLLNLQNNPQV